MSEFLCRCGETFITSKTRKCELCGSGAYTMDGMTASELDALERIENEENDYLNPYSD